MKLVMIAREITAKEIALGIGTERSGTRLSPIFKTLDLYLPIKEKKLFKPAIPINPFEGTPMLMMPLLFVPHETSVLFGTPSILEMMKKQTVQPQEMVLDPGKGTANPLIAAAIAAPEDEILILAPCDQYHSQAITKAVNEIVSKMVEKGYQSGTVLTTGTRNPAFSYLRVKDDRAIEFILKGTIPKDDMIAETMIVCVRVGFLKKQILEMKDASLQRLKETYPFDESTIKKIQTQLKQIGELIENCKEHESYLKQCPFCDFSKVIHRLLIPDMTFAVVKYQEEWDDLGDWQKVYNSPLFPKDEHGNVVFSLPELLSYTNCQNSMIANFGKQKVIINGLKKRIFAVGSRGTIDIPLELDPQEFKKEVIKLQM